MKLCDLLRDVEILESHAPGELEIADIAYDSRKVSAGSAFVAIRGFESDGHRYIPQAAEKGAACVICEEKPAVDMPYVQHEVKDIIACYYHALLKSAGHIERTHFGKTGKKIRAVHSGAAFESEFLSDNI